METPWSVHSGRGSLSPTHGRSSVYYSLTDRDKTDGTRQQSPLSMTDMFTGQSERRRTGGSAREDLVAENETGHQYALGVLDEPLMTEKEMHRLKKGGLTTAEERETEILATMRDLTDRNEELQRELQVMCQNRTVKLCENTQHTLHTT